MPELVSAVFAARTHDRIVELLEWIELRDRHQAVRAAASKE
jgi:hypothetical protein